MVPRFVGNLVQTVKAQTVNGVIEQGSACSGSEVWHHFNKSVFQHWDAQYDIVHLTGTKGFVSKLCAENDIGRQQFIQQQFDPEVMLSDVAQFDQNEVTNCKAPRSGKVPLPFTKHFGSGFSCLGRSKANIKRSENVGACRIGESTTGIRSKKRLSSFGISE